MLICFAEKTQNAPSAPAHKPDCARSLPCLLCRHVRLDCGRQFGRLEEVIDPPRSASGHDNFGVKRRVLFTIYPASCSFHQQLIINRACVMAAEKRGTNLTVIKK